jgi:hypothetical protein
MNQDLDIGIVGDLVDDIDARAQRSVVLAGHYSLSAAMTELSHLGETEQGCFRHGARIVSALHARGRSSSLVLWINDIGIDSADRAREKAAFRIPDNYQRILADCGLAPDAVTVLFESTMRNKASVLLRKLYARSPQIFRKVPAAHHGLVRCVSNATCELDTAKDAYVVDGPSSEQLVVKEGPNPKCNLILATLFSSLGRSAAPDRFVNIFNDVYAYRISLGMHVARTILDCQTDMTCLYCDGTRITSVHDTTWPAQPVADNRFAA